MTGPRFHGRRGSERGDERAVSEVVGYLFIFGIVMATISIIYVNATPTLLKAQEQNYLANVDQSFRVIAFNMNRILTGSAPSQSAEVKLKDSTVSILRLSTLNISWTNNSLGGESTGDKSLIAVRHDFQNRSVAYEGGGVWTQTPGGGVAMLVRPPFALGNTTVIAYATQTTSNVSSSGTGVIHPEILVSCRVLGQCAPTTRIYPNASRVLFNVTSPYCMGWKNYFEREWLFQSAHFDDSDCGDNRIIANISMWMGGANTTLFLTEVQMEGYLQ